MHLYEKIEKSYLNTHSKNSACYKKGKKKFARETNLGPEPKGSQEQGTMLLPFSCKNKISFADLFKKY